MAQINKALSFKVFESKFYAGESINTIKAAMKNIVDSSTVCRWYRAACECIARHRATAVRRVSVQYLGPSYTTTKVVGTVVNGLWFSEKSVLSGRRLEWFYNAGYTVVEVL